MLLIIFAFIGEADLDSALSYIGLNQNSLSFEKLGWVFDTKYYLPIVGRLMDKPLTGFDYIKTKRKDFSNGIITSYRSISKDLGYSIKPDIKTKRAKNLAEFVGIVSQNLSSIKKEINDSYKTINEYRRNRLLYELTDRLSNEEDSTDDYFKGAITREFNIKVDTTIPFNTDTLMNWYFSTNREELQKAGLNILELLGWIKENIGTVKLSDTTVVFNTNVGKIAIGGKGDDIYKGNYTLIIDVGGNDQYYTRGTISNITGPITLIVDLSGNDYYSGTEFVGTGGAILGISVIDDENGNDYYRSGNISLGAAMFGLGILMDEKGDDTYEGGILSEGAGYLGTGILYDSSGDDRYAVQLYGEGFAGIGSYGLLFDGCGNDIYYAGGRYRHTPLLPDAYQSLSQGFSIGERPDYGGGVGFLCDMSGNDFYNAEVYAQGTSYWFSAGFLYDGLGNDIYNANEYAQGAGIHLSYGFLYDRAGQDHYFSRHGPSQGEGHDFAVGIMVDSSGNDWYSVSGGLGIGLNNSFGLFIDGEGNDVYKTTEKNNKKPFGMGDINWGRGFAGAGIFLDLAGNDNYIEGRFGNDKIWTRDLYSIGIDKNSRVVKPLYKQRPVPDFTKMSVEEVFKIASEWGVGDNQDRVKKAREELALRGRDALDYIFKEKINTKSSLDLRAIDAALKENKAKAKPFLLKAISDNDPHIKKNVCYFIGKYKVKEAEDSLIKYLGMEKNENLVRYYIYALGDIKTKKVKELISYLSSNREDTRIATIKALGTVGDTSTIPALINALGSPLPTIRSTIDKSIQNFGLDAIPYIKKYWKNYPYLLYIGGKIVKNKEGEAVDKMMSILFDGIKRNSEMERRYATMGLVESNGTGVKQYLETIVGGEKDPMIRSILKEYLHL